MNTQRIIAAVGLISLITLTGAGCSSKNSPGPNTTGNTADTSNSQNSGKNDSYNSSINLELPDSASKATNSQAQNLVEGIFGKVKITSFLQNFPTKDSVSVEFTLNRTVGINDATTLAKAVKDAGFTIIANGVQDGAGVIISQNAKDSLIFTFTIGEQKVGAVSGPKDQMPTDSESSS